MFLSCSVHLSTCHPQTLVALLLKVRMMMMLLMVLMLMIIMVIVMIDYLNILYMTRVQLTLPVPNQKPPNFKVAIEKVLNTLYYVNL